MMEATASLDLSSNEIAVPPLFTRLLASAVSHEPDYVSFNRGYQRVKATLFDIGEFDFWGLKLTTAIGIYPPSPGSSTDFVARNWSSAHLDCVSGELLELGSGCGALSLFAARGGWRVSGGDIAPLAVSVSMENARLNGLNADFRESDLFSAFVGQLFDVVLFNLPFFHKAFVESDELPLADANGRLARRLLDEAKAYLKPDGRLVFTFSNCSDVRLLERTDWKFELAGCDFEGRGRYWRALVVARPV